MLIGMLVMLYTGQEKFLSVSAESSSTSELPKSGTEPIGKSELVNDSPGMKPKTSKNIL
jgi:hypothetical protein